jgi:hypothetical protein
MRRLILGLSVGLGLLGITPCVRAQAQAFSPGFSDPFFLYYGVYLPRQQYLASQPTTATQLNDVAIARQNYALSDRSGLRAPMASPFEMPESGGELLPYQRRQRLPNLPHHFAQPRNMNNRALPHFNELGSRFPGAKNGSFANRNVPMTRRGGPSLGAGAAGAVMPPVYGGR